MGVSSVLLLIDIIMEPNMPFFLVGANDFVISLYFIDTDLASLSSY